MHLRPIEVDALDRRMSSPRDRASPRGRALSTSSGGSPWRIRQKGARLREIERRAQQIPDPVRRRRQRAGEAQPRDAGRGSRSARWRCAGAAMSQRAEMESSLHHEWLGVRLLEPEEALPHRKSAARLDDAAVAGEREMQIERQRRVGVEGQRARAGGERDLVEREPAQSARRACADRPAAPRLDLGGRAAGGAGRAEPSAWSRAGRSCRSSAPRSSIDDRRSSVRSSMTSVALETPTCRSRAIGLSGLVMKSISARNAPAACRSEADGGGRLRLGRGLGRRIERRRIERNGDRIGAGREIATTPSGSTSSRSSRSSASSRRGVSRPSSKAPWDRPTIARAAPRRWCARRSSRSRPFTVSVRP